MPAATFYQPVEKELNGQCSYEYYNQYTKAYSIKTKSRICHVILDGESDKNKNVILMIFTIRNQPSAIKNPVWKIHSEGPKRTDPGAVVPLRNTAVKLAKDNGWKYIAIAVAPEDTPDTDMVSKYIISMESYSYGNDTVYDLSADLEELHNLGDPDFYRKDISVNGATYSLSFIKKGNFIHYLSMFDNRPYSSPQSIPQNYPALTPEWFYAKAKEFTQDDAEAVELYADFKEKYGIDALRALSGEDLLKTLFLGASTNNLCHDLEYVARNTELFGSIKGGNAYKYPLFFDKDAALWTSGTRANPKQVSIEEAIEYGTTVRDGLIRGAEIICNSLPVESVKDYLSLYTELYSAIPDLVDSMWVMKYYHMLFPELVPVFYNRDWQNRVLSTLRIEPNDTAYGRLGQINEFVKECGITNVAFARVFHTYCLGFSTYNDEYEEASDAVNVESPSDIVPEYCLKANCLEVIRTPRTSEIHPLNFIIYGAPGTGKTYSTAEYALAIIENRAVDTRRKSYEERKAVMAAYNDYVRKGQIVFTTFHQSYGYEEFIQGLRPDTKSDKMAFITVDGVFKRIADDALDDHEKNYVIIIDEINRANISKVFGELITLIESDKRWGEVNETCATLQSGDVFAVPNNLYIVGTMNSADKSISLIDAALRRRFEFIEQYPNASLVDDPTLRDVLTKINTILADSLESSDLLIGHSYFMGKTVDDLCAILNNSIIPLLYEYYYDNKKKVIGVLTDALKDLGIKMVDDKISRVRVEKADVQE
jgi:hypothetical protein